MPAERRKLNVIVFVGLGVLMFALGCMLPSGAGYPNSLAPVRILTLTIDKSQRKLLFDQLRSFSETHGFEYKLTDFNTNGERFQFWMSKDDMFITASDVPPDPSLVYIAFYDTGSSVDEDFMDDLLSDIKNLINEIPNVTITEEK